jgi:hypothetical protein
MMKDVPHASESCTYLDEITADKPQLASEIAPLPDYPRIFATFPNLPPLIFLIPSA